MVCTYNLAVKRRGILTHAIIQDEPCLKEVRHSQKNTIYFYLYEVPTIVKYTETESRMVVARG